jgi:hypothetical protein
MPAMPGTRRSIKLLYTEKSIHGPHCRADLRIGTVIDTIVLSQRTCTLCDKEFLIENDVPRKLADDLKKPSGSVKPARAAKKKSR